MDVTSSTSINAVLSKASSGTPGTVGHAVGLLVLRKALDAQASGAAALLTTLPQPPALASEGHLGRNLDTYA